MLVLHLQGEEVTITQQAIRELRAQDVKVLTRRQWGSTHQEIYAYRRRYKPAFLPADTVVQHITVTRDTGDFKADVRRVETIGFNRFGSGISYNWIVNMKTGVVAAGMPLDAKGTHTVNLKRVPGFSYDQNYRARAIAVLGMPEDKLSRKAKHSIAAILVAMARVGAITREPDYLPHSTFAAKDCPCESTRSQMDAIYRRFQRRL